MDVAAAHPVRPVPLGLISATLDRRADGTMVVRSHGELGNYPRRSTDRLAQWAADAADRPMLAWRGVTGGFEAITYADAFDAVRHIGQALLDRGLSPARPVAILSGNDREHALLTLAAQHVGIPVCPISPAYSTASRDFAMLKHAMGLLTPGLAFASDASRFGDAIAAAVPDAAEIVMTDRMPRAWRHKVVTGFGELSSTPVTDAVQRAHDAITPDTIAKILLTSGSTAVPKGVINTHRMLCSNQQMIGYVLPFLRDEPPVPALVIGEGRPGEVGVDVALPGMERVIGVVAATGDGERIEPVVVLRAPFVGRRHLQHHRRQRDLQRRHRDTVLRGEVADRRDRRVAAQ